MSPRIEKVCWEIKLFREYYLLFWPTLIFQLEPYLCVCVCVYFRCRQDMISAHVTASLSQTTGTPSVPETQEEKAVTVSKSIHILLPPSPLCYRKNNTEFPACFLVQATNIKHFHLHAKCHRAYNKQPWHVLGPVQGTCFLSTGTQRRFFAS